MSRSTHTILRIPETVVQDTHEYRSRVERFLSGETNPVAFRAYRVPMGVYEQRTPDTYMVRVRIGAGLVLPHQLEHIAQLSRRFGNGVIHLTTRQDIQIHSVKIEDTPDILEGLLEVGLSSRGGGGNTVRNITACPRSGLCPYGKFDVSGHAVALAEYLIACRSSFNLPRKYKIVFSGCETDCAFASVADLGFFAHIGGGKKGFSVYAAGGLGANPGIAVKIEDFIPETDIFEVAEAIKRLFDAHGDRTNKHKARLRYVLRRLGPEEFITLYRGYREQLLAEGLPVAVPEIREIITIPAPNPNDRAPVPLDPDVLMEGTPGYYSVRLRPPLGDITAEDLIRLSQLALKYGTGCVRVTQLQNLVITSVRAEDVQRVLCALDELESTVNTEPIPRVVACTGASTCKLGLCLSRGLADVISERFVQEGLDDPDTVVRISGCPNSCANHHIAQIGFQGRARRVGDRLLPCYDVFVNARTIEGDAKLAERAGVVPAREIPDLLAHATTDHRLDTGKLAQLVRDRGQFDNEELPDVYFYDYGSSEPFSLAGRGPGECGAGVVDVIQLDVDQSLSALEAARDIQDPQQSDELYKATLSAARALLVIFGLEPRKDREVAAACKKHLIAPGWLACETSDLLDVALDYRMGDTVSLCGSVSAVETLVGRVRELFHSLDASLKFTLKPLTEADAVQLRTDATIVDLRGVGCPLNFVKAKLELEKLDIGRALDILLDAGEPARNVPASFAEQGHEVLDVEDRGGHYCVTVKRVT